MMLNISAATNRFRIHPAPILIIDTCNFLDLFRRDSTPSQPRVPADEIRIASELRQTATVPPGAVHLVVPELVPREFADHADRIESEFEHWLEGQDQNQAWLAAAAPLVGITLPKPSAVQPRGLHAGLRRLADELLARALVLDRDLASLDRAVSRLIARRRPSHNKEIKDSMNLEQSLGLCAQLRSGGFTRPVAFISSNTKDYAAATPKDRLHGDLQSEFTAVSLEYFPSLRAAVGSLRARGELP